jgi:GT2 family glycosyltransferase
MAQTLAQSIEAIRTITTYPHWEIVIVDNGSTEAATLALFKKYQAELGTAFSVSRHDIPFNFSKLVNQGVKAAQGEIILLLNNDTEILGPPDWLQEMIGFAQHPEIASVSCKLLYPSDNSIQHAGVICGVGGIANHGHKHFPAESRGYFDRLAMVANYSAITGACLMVKRELWEQINGFDENLPIAFNDIDFCLKLQTKGLRHVVLPHVTIYHHESKTRGLEDSATKQARLSQSADYMESRWGTLLQNDPFYSPHLTRDSEDFALSRDSIYYCGHSENPYTR